MSNLSMFLKKNKKVRENIFYPASADFTDADGKTIEWELRAVTTAENERIREACTKEVSDRRGGVQRRVDSSAYMAQLAAAAVVRPNLYDAALQDSYGVKTPEALLREMIDNAGEYAALLEKVSELSGFNRDFRGEVDEAKN